MAKAAAQNGAKGNGGGEAAVAAAASSSSSSSFEWIPGRLEVIPCHACLLHFDILTAGAAWLSKWDINHTVSQVAKDEPLYNDLTIGRDSASLAVGYATLEPVSKLMALDGRQVIISESQVGGWAGA